MPLLSKSDYLYQVRVYTAGGTAVAVYDDLTSLYYKKQVNHIGLAVLTVPDTHPILDLIVDDLLLEIWFISAPPSGGSISDAQDFIGLYRDHQVATDGDGNTYYMLYFLGTLDILKRYIMAYPPGVNNKTSWVGARVDTIAVNIVDANCTANATTANGRLRTATVIKGLTATGGGLAAIVNYAASYRNVLEVLQTLADLGGFDFDILRPSTASINLTFSVYYPILGSDLHTTIIFDLNLDNVKTANLDGERLKENTVAIVGGAGEGAARAISIRTGANYSATNEYEIFVDARNSASTELAAIGDAKLAELQARTNINVDIAPSSGYVYRRDYKLGDLVTASFAGVMLTKKISTVEVKFDQDQNTTVRIELTDP